MSLCLLRAPPLRGGEDDGDDYDDNNKEHYPPFAMPKKMTDFKWVLGARFGTKDEFKEAIINYAIYNARLKGFV
ncbi:hypothetical protein MTR_8g466960 [Medicago truncatula]|uniref:Uncharacterized protein n=1 Tax=Medicago truncatula TaxID=3880 RepID=A0A072TQL8_MEDTR|nr:hypothetical protein MTR_8g466960 [Medicago truncatula]